MNEIVGTVCSVCTLIPYRYWAKNHSYHHAHNGQLEVSDIGDIEVFTTDQYANATWKTKIYYRIYRNPLYLFTIGGFIYVVIYNRFAFISILFTQFINDFFIGIIYLQKTVLLYKMQFKCSYCT